MKNTKNLKGIIGDIAKYTLFAGASLFASQKITAQTQNDFQRQRIEQAYSNLENSVMSGASNPSQLSQNDEKTLESFLGIELYHQSMNNLQTFPASGNNCIDFMNGEYWVHVVQVGSGYAKFMEENIRDKSFTYTTYANRAGYDGSDFRSDDRLKQIISFNSGISPFEINIQRDALGKVDDILYTGNNPELFKGDDPVVRNHRRQIAGKQSGITENHILMQRAHKFYFPLEDIMKIVGYEVPNYVPEEPVTYEAPRLEPPKPKEEPCCTPKQVEKDSIIHRMAVGGFGTNGRAVPGIYVASQIGNCKTDNFHQNFWVNTDLEAGYGFLKINGADGAYDLFSEEVKTHPTIPELEGHSQLSEYGKSVKDLHMITLDAIHYGKKRIFGVGLGLTGTIVNENIVGKEDRETFFIQNEDWSNKIAYDETVTDITKHINYYSLSPTIGVRLNMGWVRAGVDYVVPVNMIDGVNKDKTINVTGSQYNSRFIGGNDAPGNFRFSLAFPINITKYDKVDNCPKKSSTDGTTSNSSGNGNR